MTTCYHIERQEYPHPDGTNFVVEWPENGNPTILIDGEAVNPHDQMPGDVDKIGALVMLMAEKIDEKDQEVADLTKALHIADVATQTATSEATPWYRRAAMAEHTLSLFAERYGRILSQDGPDPDQVCIPFEDLKEASMTLALNTGGEVANLEVYVRNRRQARILAWMGRTFVPMPDSVLAPERALRFLEEALELYQAVLWAHSRDCPQEIGGHYAKASRLFNAIFNRPPGDAKREFGQVALTLLALAETQEVSVAQTEIDEFARVLSVPRQDFQQRHQEKKDLGL